MKYLLIILLFLLAPRQLLAQDVSVSNSESYPAPDVTTLVVDEGLLHDRWYQVVTGDFTIFDAPDGTISEVLGAGFNYVTLSEEHGNWARIAPDQWINKDELSDNVIISRFAGILLPEGGLTYTTAWTLRHVRPSYAAGGDEYPDNPFLHRYTLVNIFETIELDGHRWYKVGSNQWLHQFDVAKVLPAERPSEVETDKWISVDLYEQVLIAYEGDTAVFATLISSGLPQWSTNEGLFNIYLRFDRTLMSGAYSQPDFYYLEEVPWTMYFDDDIALHGTYWHDSFGYRHSHGCVNMSITDAHWLYRWTSDATDANVYVYSSGEYE